MTDIEMAKKFERLYPDVKVASFDGLNWLSVSGMPGIQITATNGDMILYFPNTRHLKYAGDYADQDTMMPAT